MCICVEKPAGIKFPGKKTLKTCFDNNPDGAGYMYPFKDRVIIKKGFMTFNSFWKSLTETRKKYGDDLPYVLHFRISTQGGINPECTHPFPLSPNMAELKKTRTFSSFGIAHNGIISLTSCGYLKSVSYSDTMTFITDYLTLIIKNKDYYKDSDKKMLIKRLIDSSKLAIMDGGGHVELIGEWIEDNGVYYSNTSYKKTVKSILPTYTEYAEEWEYFYNSYIQKYEFDASYCPYTLDGATDYCSLCANACWEGGDENDDL